MVNQVNRYIIFFILFGTILFKAAAMETPKRIISLAPSITESLYALDAQNELVGVTTYCDYPDDAKTKTKIGTLINPNIEKILSINPDLILTVENVNRIQTIEKLKNLGLKIVILKESNNFNDIIDNFLNLSEIVDKKAAAEEIIKDARKKINELTKEIHNSEHPRIFWQVNVKPLVTVGKNTFANSIIELSGGTNIFNDVDDKYPRLNYEEVILRNPQIIILVTMGDVTAQQRLFWQKFKQVDAVQNNRIYVVDANLVCKPTITRFLTGLETIKSILNLSKYEDKNNE